MISILKHIDTFNDPLTESSLAGWRSSLLAMAECAGRAVPGLGQDLNQKLGEAEQALAAPVTAAQISNTSTGIEQELTAWANRASEHHADSVQEIRAIIAVVTQAGDSVARRDENYVQQLGALNGRLQALAQLESLPVMKRSILESTRELKSCVEKMAEEGKESLRKLSGEVAEYRKRLEESERISATDPLTQLANRRAFEMRLNDKISAKQNFSLIIMDLNGFKIVNDQYGHMAGDDLLRQFAEELRGQFRPGDLLARWGGDEFVAIVGVPLDESRSRVEQIRKWALGDYKIKTGNQTVKVTLQAAFGVVQWDRFESGPELLERADACLYALKPERGFPEGSRRGSDLAAARQ